MSVLNNILAKVSALTTLVNSIISNSKKIEELPEQTIIDTNSDIHVSKSGTSERLKISQIISKALSLFLNNNNDQITTIGTITRDGNNFTFSDFEWRIGGVNYSLITPQTITIDDADAGSKRIDIAVFNTYGNIIKISGEESETIAIQPPTPLSTILITSWNIEEDTIDEGETPIIGTDVVKKSFSRMFEFNGSGSNAIIPLNANGYSEIRLINAGLTSVSGVDLSLMSAPGSEFPYIGKSFLIWNLTGGSVTLKHNDIITADLPFFFSDEQDCILADNDCILLYYDSTGLYEVGSKVDLSKKADLVDGKVPTSQLPSYVDDVLEFANLASFPVTGETSKIYLALDTNLSYRWSGSTYVDLNSSKLDKVSTVDVQKVYVKNADGTQGMKAVSEIGGGTGVLNFSWAAINFTALNTWKTWGLTASLNSNPALNWGTSTIPLVLGNASANDVSVFAIHNRKKINGITLNVRHIGGGGSFYSLQAYIVVADYAVVRGNELNGQVIVNQVIATNMQDSNSLNFTINPHNDLATNSVMYVFFRTVAGPAIINLNTCDFNIF